MKKKIILIFIFLLLPFLQVNAISQNQINAEVQIICPDNYGNWYSGSGTIIDSKGIVLTNKHVVTDKYGDTIKTCIIGFIEKIEQDPSFKTDNKYNFAEVKYYTTSKDSDAAILYLENTINKIYPYINIWDSNSSLLKLGDKIEVIGFPSIGGSTITYTSGDFSGFGSSYNGTQNYIKTTAQLEHGNSGGASYNINGKFIGIPTMVISGSLNSMSYILSVNNIKEWLSNKLGINYQNDIKQENAEIKEKEEIIYQTEKQEDKEPPYLEEFRLGYNAFDNFGKEIAYRDWKASEEISQIEPYNKVKFFWYENCLSECIKDNSGEIKGYYYYFGKNPLANPIVDGFYISSEDIIKESAYLVTWSKKGPATKVRLTKLIELDSEGTYYFILKAVDKNNNISGNLFNFEYIYEKEEFKELEYIEIYDKNKNKIGEVIYPINWYEEWKMGSHGFLNLGLYTNIKELYLKPIYKKPTNKFIYYIDQWNVKCNTERCDDKGNIEEDFIKWEFGMGDNVFIKPFNEDKTKSFLERYGVLKISYDKNLKENFKKAEYSKLIFEYNTDERASFDKSLAKRLAGKILLKVEDKGQAYYVNPDDSKMYSLGLPSDAFNVMRELGLGVSNSNFDSWGEYAPKNLAGKILLKVEDKGQAYYVNPDDLKMHYLGLPSDAFNVMRNLGLGITNDDIRKIDIN